MDEDSISQGCAIAAIVMFLLAVVGGSCWWDYTTCGKKLDRARTSADSSYIIKESSCDVYVRWH